MLHEASSFGSTKITKFIVDHFPFLLTKKNILGDSAIHVATKNKHLKVLEVHINSSIVELQMRNSIGNTTLHEAMFFPICYEAINILFWGDPNMAYILNEDRKSLLCLATPDMQIVGLLLLVPYGNRGLIGRSRLELPFYVAIRMKRLGIFFISSKKGHIKAGEIFLERQWHNPSKLLNSLGQKKYCTLQQSMGKTCW